MNCLNDFEVQAAVDGEAEEVSRAHLVSCERCKARVDERRQDMAELTAMMGAAELPVNVEARLRRALDDEAVPRGSTVLRLEPRASWHRTGWLSAAATAAGVTVVVFLILPRLVAPTSLSASEVLGRSLQTISGTAGVERLEYDLFIAGEMAGPQRIEQVIDHDHPGRYRISTYRTDGVLESAIAQDPSRNQRVHLFHVDDRDYLLNLTWAGTPRLSLPEVGQALVETAISLMQSTSDQKLTTVDVGTDRKYVVEMPQVTPGTAAAMLDLHQARALIDARDYRIEEFDASGVVLKQPFSVSFRLIRRSSQPSAEVPASEFDIPAGPDTIVIAGEADRDPVFAVMGTVLRELGRLRGR